ncbi:MAG: hypothetical protein FWH10_09065 [Oscillospiraceae bacterium]|nr:hypothetical protein [Oscillospiraceae bacterium]
MKSDFDYRRIFNENIKADGESGGKESDKTDRTERKKQREKKYIATFLIQSLVCVLIIGSIIAAKYTTPRTFVSVSSALNGLYANNITLSDLTDFIDKKLSGNDTLAAFFNMNGGGDGK